MILALLFAAALSAEPPAPVPEGRPVLHLDEALQIALAAQPTVRQAHAQTQAADARVLEARAPLLPQVTANLGYQAATTNYIVKPGNLPNTVKQQAGSTFSLANNLTGSVIASQLVWDFGQTLDKWHAAKDLAVSQADSESATRLLTTLSVRTAFFGALGAKALLAVAQDAVANMQRHVTQAQGFFEEGAKPKLDVVQAQSDLATAQVQRIQAENTYRTSKVQLNQAIGREGPGDFEVGDDRQPPVDGEDQGFAALFADSLKVRPEIAQLEAQIRAQQQLIGSVEGAWWPSVGVSTAFNGGGPDFTQLGWNWNAQATLTWPVFQGLQTCAQLEEARANLAALVAQRDGERQQVALELEQARLAVEAGKSALASAVEALALAHERLELAEGRYQTGAGSIIELTDAQSAFTSAGGQKVSAEYSLAVARAQLLKALGRP